MEWASPINLYKYKSKKISPLTLLEFCNDYDYYPYNIYGICLFQKEIFEASVFKDTYDVILVPKEKIIEWSTKKLPAYQYAILDKICGRIKNFEPYPGYYSLTSLCRRIYECVNNSPKETAIQFFSHLNNHLNKILTNESTIENIETLWPRGRLQLMLIYRNKLEDAYNLSIIKKVDLITIEFYKSLLKV